MQIEQDGMASVISLETAKTLDGLFNERVQCSPKKVAYRYFNLVSEQWSCYTWERMNQLVARWQAALEQEALVPGDRVAIMTRNCPEWVMFEQAALSLGLVVIPLYTDDRVENAAYIISDANIKLLLLENSHQWQEFFAIRDQIEGLQRIVILRSYESGGFGSYQDDRVLSTWDWLPRTSVLPSYSPRQTTAKSGMEPASEPASGEVSAKHGTSRPLARRGR